jgi:atypical dual specificity phosphatase
MRHLIRRVRLMLCGMGILVDRGDWLVAEQLLGCAFPRRDVALAALSEQGISVLVNLHERAHPAERLQSYGFTSVHFPIKDFTTPTPEQLEQGIAAIEEALKQGQRVAVHCGGGLGRTGTVLACYLVHEGASADHAIERVRQLRPGSIETRAQVDAIRTFAARHRGRDSTDG